METKEPGYLRQLDGLRALSVAAVAWSHWRAYWNHNPSFFPGAELGVETFFVISGFLITGILLDNRSVELRSAVLKQFYIRRFLRIFPLFYATITVALLFEASCIAETWQWHVSYLSNIYFYEWGWRASLSHFWSLAVEEQFYLFWPLLVLLLPARFLKVVIPALILAAPVYALSMNVSHPGFLGIISSSILMPSCLSALGMGAFVAYLIRQMKNVRKWMNWSLGLGLAGTVAWHFFGSPDWLAPFNRLAVDGVLGWLIFSTAEGFQGPVGWFLQCPPMNYLGKISYGLYIIHNFAKPILFQATVHLSMPQWMFNLCQSPRVSVLLLMIITVGLASLSWHFFEKPINRLKRHFPYPVKP